MVLSVPVNVRGSVGGVVLSVPVKARGSGGGGGGVECTCES